METGYIDHFTELTMQIVYDMLQNIDDIGDGYELTVVEMTDDEFDILPEFEGF